MRKIVYLDFDGVLNPWRAQNPQKHWPDYRKATVEVCFDPEMYMPPREIKVWHSRLLGAALWELTNHGIEIVWASTWCANNQANKLLVDLFDLPELRTLPYFPNSGKDWDWHSCGKLEVVYNDVNDHKEDTAFVWIDDDLGRTDYKFLEETNACYPDDMRVASYIRPDPAVGLRQQDIDAIIEFFKNIPEENHGQV